RHPRQGDVLARPEPRPASRTIPRREDQQMTHRYAIAFGFAALSATTTLDAQSLADRVSRAGNGTIRMTFATRPELCGRGGSIHRGPNWRTSWGDYDRTRDVE